MPYLIEFERAHTSDRAVTVRIIDPAADSPAARILAETTFPEGLPGGVELKPDAVTTLLRVTHVAHHPALRTAELERLLAALPCKEEGCACGGYALAKKLRAMMKRADA